jgi:beta-aspartyl-peptidase (threonine type)
MLRTGCAAARIGGRIALALPGSLVTSARTAGCDVGVGEGGWPARSRDRAGRPAADVDADLGKRAGRRRFAGTGAGTGGWRGGAVSATGDGEAILRVALARSISMRLAAGLDAAVRASLAELHRITGGHAGVIAIGRETSVTMQLSATMPVAWIDGERAGDGMGCTLALAVG